MKNNKTIKLMTTILAVILILTTSILPAFAVGHDPYIGGEYDYSEKGVINVEVVDTYNYGGYTGLNAIGHCEYFLINGKTAHCCWSNMWAPISSNDNRTKYYIGNHASRAKAIYYFAYANSATPSARNEKIASGMPTTFLGKNITYYKDYIQAVTDYARANRNIDGEVNYNNLNNDVMAYIVSHLVLDDMMNGGNGFRSADRVISVYSSLVVAAHKLVTDILYNSSVINKVPSVPSSYRVFYCFPDRESGRNDQSQGLMSIEGIPTGGFMIDKRSTNGTITDKSGCYSFQGAEFEVYTKADLTGKIKTIITDQGGYAEIDGLTPGTYYFKETVAPKGYKLNPDIFTVNVKSGDKPSDNTVKVYDEPLNDPAVISIFKNDPDHIEKDEHGNDVKKGIPGVKFELSYYDVDPETVTSLADLSDKTPKRTWILKTDSRGGAAIDNKWKIDGDDFYYQKNSSGELFGNPIIPLGCLTLKEIETAPGYVLDPTVRFARVTASMAENHENIKFSGTALVNDSLDYPNSQTTTEISKISITTQKELPGASLKVTDKEGKVIDEWVSTNKAHIIRGLFIGETYTLTETIPAPGYTTAEAVKFTVLGNNEVTKVTMKDDVTKYKFIKTDENGNALRGVVLKVEEDTNKEDKFVEEWTTDGTPHEIIGKLVVGKSYKLIEVKAPNGYTLAEPISFKVDDNNDTKVITMKNFSSTTEISKKSITTQEELPGASLKVTDKDGKIIDKWVSTTKAHIIHGLTIGETYTLTETIPVAGYTTAEAISFTVLGDNKVTKVTMYDDVTKYRFNKVNEKGEPLSGAVLRVEEDTDKADKFVEEWTTDGTPHEIIGKLVVGKSYKLIEVKAPNGYYIAEPVSFKINDNSDMHVVTMKDTETTTEISKKSITNKKELPGASLKVTDKNGKVIDKWVSTDKPHIIRGLTVGEKYTLTETIPAAGYVTAESVEFTVLGNNKVTSVTMYDDVTKYRFIKEDGKGKPLSGVVLRVEEDTDKEDKFIEEWTTDGTPHDILGKLVVGKSYKLIEVKAPDGYLLAEPITFKVGDNSDMHVITMKNIITSTYISKKSITTQEELPGAKLEVKDKDGKVVDSWTSTNKEHLIEGLKVGEKYTLTETISPDGYVVSTDIEFTVNSDGTTTHVEMTDDITKFKFIKVAEDGSPVEGAILRIEEYKGITEPDLTATSDEAKPGTEIWEPVEGEEWTTDKEGTPHEVNGKLVVGKRYRLVEVTAPNGYNLATPIEFTVENTAEPVEVKMVDTITSVSKTDITGENEIPGARLIVRDKDGNIVDEWVSTDEHHHVQNLIEGETYTLEEIIPAPGYVTAAPIEFTVTKDGISTFVTMKDAPTKIVISKIDDNNKPVSGAKLQILDKDKNVIEEWTTDGNVHLIEAKLIVGETYILHEVSAPEGYEVAKDIEFTVKDTADEQVITMTDVYKGEAKISTPDQPTTSKSSQNGGSQVRTGQNTFGLMIAIAVLMISAAFIISYRKKRTNKN